MRRIKEAKNVICEFAVRNKWILLVMLVLFIERIAALCFLGTAYTLNSDDAGYVASGISFANSGRITMHGDISAQITPGMPVFIGILSLVFGEGALLWTVLKLCWIIMGVVSAYFVYRSMTLFAPNWCGLICSLVFFAMPNVVWMDNLILTETPYAMLLTILIYATLALGKKKESKYFIILVVSYMLALMFRATIAAYPIYAAVYLLLMKYDTKKLLRNMAVIGIALLCFIIPWSIRNYVIYDAFIPLTYGSGNAMLAGTYQGVGYPEDSELDYETNVYSAAREKFEKYYDENGEIDPKFERYVTIETEGMKANYRIKEWFRKDPINMFLSYFCYKPMNMVITPFYWRELIVSRGILVLFRIVIFFANILFLCLSMIRRRSLRTTVFLAMLYVCNILMFSMSFSFDRYGETLMPIQYILFGIGLSLFYDEIKKYLKIKIKG